MMKRSLKLLLCAVLALSLILGCAGAGAEGTERKKVTVMVYMCGADLEQLAKGTQTISEMYSTHFNQDAVNVIALCGGTRRWASRLDDSVLSVVDVGKGGRRSLHVAAQLPLASMGQPSTLSSFLQLCHDQYPAEIYDLVLWDHGGGPVGGVCWDQKFGEDQLTTAEVAEALEASPFRDRGLDLLIMHACLMGSAEFANRVAPYARYYVASEDSQYGLTYSWLNGVETRDSLETAKMIAKDSFDFNTMAIERQHAEETNSFSVIDLSRMPELKESVNAFFDGFTTDLSDTRLNAMSAYRRDSQAFGLGESGGDSDFDLVDLGDLIQHYREYAPEKADAVMKAIGNAVVYNPSVKDDNCCGLTVYHPYRARTRMNSRLEIYATLDFAENYYAYIRAFADYLASGPKANWVKLDTDTPSAQKDARTIFVLSLTEEQAAQYGESALKVLLKGEDDSYTFTYMSRNTALDEGKISGEYVQNALFAVGPDGTKLTEPVSYTVNENGQWSIPAVLIRHATEETEETEATEETEHQALILYDPAEGKLIPGPVRVKDEGTGGYTSAYATTLNDYDEIRLSFISRKETRNEQDTLLPFDEWEAADTRTWSGALDGSWELRVIPESLDESALYVTFEVTDTQNNRYSSRLRKVKQGADALPDPVLNYDDLGLILLKRPTIALTGDQLQFSLTVTNLTETESVVALKNLTINGTALAQTAEAYGNGENWGLLQNEEQLLSLSVPRSDLPEGILTEIAFDLTLRNAATEEEGGTVPVKAAVHLDPAGE